MAKVQGPLLSLDAKGTVRKAISYSDYRGITRVKVYVKPVHKPVLPTSGQIVARQKFSVCFNNWQTLSGSDKILFNTAARSKHMSGFNLYMKKCVTGQNVPHLQMRTLAFYLDSDNTNF